MEIWRIKQIKSSNSATKRQIATRALGLRRINHFVEKEATPVIRAW